MVRKKELGIGLTFLVIATLAFLFGWTNLFTVKHVTVSGSPNQTITSQVLHLADIQKGTKLARIEPKVVTSKLSSLDWIASVQIKRNWISRSVDLHLIPRIAIAKAGEQYVDSDGVSFTSPVVISGSFPTISAADQASRNAGIKLLITLPLEFSKKISKVVATSESNFQILMEDNLRIIWGENRDNQLKIKIFKALLQLPENSKINIMDVSDPTKPTVK